MTLRRSTPKTTIRSLVRAQIIIAALLGAVLATTGVAGAATLTCGGRDATIVGTNGDDRIVGTAGPDVIVALDGKDKIFGLGGADIICGGRGRDRIYGGTGSDKIFGNGGNDRLVGQVGKDVIRGGNGADYILGRAGDDKLYGDSGNDRLMGGRGVDLLAGGIGDDTLDGDDDRDILRGELGIDYCEPSTDATTSCELPGGNSSRAGVPYEDEMHSIINTERVNVGLSPLGRHHDLDSYAQDWAVEMSAIPLPLNGSRHHSPAFTGSSHPFRGLPDSVHWTSAYENVGYATVSGSDSPESVMHRLFHAPNGFGFMSSDGHRCNILETAADEIGLGAYVDSNGAVWVVQVFWGTGSTPAPISSCASVVSR